MTPPDRVFDDAGAMADALAEEIADRLREGLKERGRALLAAAGGTTPAPIYGALRRMSLAWDRVTVVPTDERRLPPDAPGTNARMLRDTLLVGPASAARLVALVGGPDVETVLAELPWPADATLIGAGADGHVASLFPGAPLDADGGRTLEVDAPGAKVTSRRVSLTMRALTDARRIALVLSGPEKAAVLERCRRGEAAHLPLAALLRQTRAPVQVFRAA